MFTCTVCGIELPSLSLYVNHFCVHLSVNGLCFKCYLSYCIKTFVTYAAFSTHMSRYHKNFKQGYNTDIDSCNESCCCSFEFCDDILKGNKALLSNLKKHMTEGTEILCPFYIVKSTV